MDMMLEAIAINTLKPFIRNNHIFGIIIYVLSFFQTEFNNRYVDMQVKVPK